MNLSISNIGWVSEQDETVYRLMKEYGYKGLEIAPTRIFEKRPYDRLEEAEGWSKEIREKYDFVITSMQSIWFGKQEKIFGTEEERSILTEYTKKAIDFAAAINCKNLVFGCPRNRNLPKDVDAESAVPFFRELGEYALSKETVIGMEANPPIYNTNYINDTSSALELIRKVNSKGFRLNLDLGTMIQNEENAGELVGNVKWINHVHISEPGLKPVKERTLHQEVIQILREENYKGFLSIEMGKTEEIKEIDRCLQYLAGQI